MAKILSLSPCKFIFFILNLIFLEIKATYVFKTRLGEIVNISANIIPYETDFSED
jgi:hypothetical protein